MTRLASTCGALALCFAGAGCSDAPVEAPGRQGGEPLRVSVVLDESQFELPHTLAGATVAIDTDDGRLEALTDAQGWAHFEHVTWTRVRDLVAHAEGATFMAHTRAAAEYYRTIHPEGELELRLFPLHPTLDVVHVRGTFLHPRGSNRLANAHPGVLGGELTGVDYDVAVPRGRPLTLYALDYGPGNGNDHEQRIHVPVYPGFRTEVEALDADRDVTIDFGAAPIPMNVTSATIPMPAFPLLHEHGLLATGVYTVDRVAMAAIGIEGSTKPTADHEHFAVATAWLDARGSDVVTQYYVFPPLELGLDSSPYISFVVMEGPPRSGDFDPGFLAHPEMVLPHEPGPHPAAEPLSWELSAGGEEPAVVVVQIIVPEEDAGGSHDLILGSLIAAGSEHEMALVPLPSSPDPKLLLGLVGEGKPILAHPYSCTRARYLARTCDKYAATKRFAVAP